jgi:hypothetical protein
MSVSETPTVYQLIFALKVFAMAGSADFKPYVMEWNKKRYLVLAPNVNLSVDNLRQILLTGFDWIENVGYALPLETTEVVGKIRE